MTKHYLLFYDTSPDYLERRAEYRGNHLAYAWSAVERGELVLGGAVAEPVDGAVLLFRSEDREAVELFARDDPYVANGLVTRWHVREWTTVVGALATTPVRPDD